MSTGKSKRNLLLAGVGVAVVAFVGFGLFGEQSQANQAVMVYKTPTCGCCHKWVEHLESNGFEVEVHDLDDLTGIKNVHQIPVGVRSCHTALVGGYAVEGHVPAEYVKRLLAEKPDIVGIGVPGMPAGSPGMEGPHSESYDVLAFNNKGRTAVWGHVEAEQAQQ